MKKLAVVALGVALGVCETLATVINFDTFPDASPVPFNTHITSQYASLGVTFSKPTEPTGPRTVSFGFAGQSGANALAGDDFPAFLNSEPIVMSFSMPISAASVMGLDVGAGGLQLQAFNAFDALIDSDSMSGTGDGIGNFGMLSISGSGITKLIVSPITPNTDAYAIDDLTFTIVPEPSSFGIAALASAGIFLRRRQFRA